MADTLNELRADLDNAYGKVRELMTEVHTKMSAVDRAGPDEDLETLLDELEDAVHKARTGGMFGGGAKAHSKARRAYLDGTQTA